MQLKNRRVGADSRDPQQGEHFRCHWDVQSPDLSDNGELIPKMALLTSTPTPLYQVGYGNGNTTEAKSKKKGSEGSITGSLAEEASSRPGTVRGLSSISSTSNSTDKGENNEMSKARRGLSKILLSPRSNSKTNVSISTSSQSASTKSPSPSSKAEDEVEDADDGASVTGSFKTSKSASYSSHRVNFLTEQVSHHPPISSFFVECKEAGIELYGVDQLSAKFTGTSGYHIIIDYDKIKSFS